MEIRKADIPYRNRLFCWYLIIAAMSMFIIAFVAPRIKRWIMKMDFLSALHTMELVLIALLAGFTPAAIYLIIVGGKTLKYDSFPYPGMKVIRDTVVVRGKKARLRGGIFIFLGVLFIICMLIGTTVIHHSFTSLIITLF